MKISQNARHGGYDGRKENHMKLGRTFTREIKVQANGNGTKGAKFAFLCKAKAACTMMSTPEVIYGKFEETLQTYGRVPVAVCVAATLYATRERIDYWGYDWACAVLQIWTNRTESNLNSVRIDDGIHPTKICEYAGSFIRATTDGSYQP